MQKKKITKTTMCLVVPLTTTIVALAWLVKKKERERKIFENPKIRILIFKKNELSLLGTNPFKKFPKKIDFRHRPLIKVFL